MINCLSLYLSVCWFIYLSVYLSVYLFVYLCLSVYLSVYFLSVYLLSSYLSVYLFFCVFISLSIYLFYLSVYLSVVCLSLCLFISLSVCRWIISQMPYFTWVMYFGLCLVIFAQVVELLIVEGKSQHYYLIVCVCVFLIMLT